ncbi:hypothetical protein K7G98_41005, partial [Saccharothrix sp. MB29]|nr:hypothetical protein [Saccharothrix sp. MB29]
PYRRALRRSCYLPPNAQTSAKALGASLPAIMTALLAHYLSRRTGAPEVIIQLPVTGRLGPGGPGGPPRGGPPGAGGGGGGPPPPAD